MKRRELLLNAMTMGGLTAGGLLAGGQLQADNEGLIVAIPGFNRVRKVAALTESDFGVSVNIEEYSNDNRFISELINKKTEPDLIIVTGSMLDQLLYNNILLPINYKYLQNFTRLNIAYKPFADPAGQYVVAPCMRYMGILANSEFKGHPNDWRMLFDKPFSPNGKKPRIGWINNGITMFRLAMLALGYDINSTNPNELKKAEELIQYSYKNNRIFLNDFSIEYLVVIKELDYSMATSSRSRNIIENQTNLHFSYPKQGYYSDDICMGVNKNTKYMLETLSLIDFILSSLTFIRVIDIMGLPTNYPFDKAKVSQSYLKSPILFPPKNIIRNEIKPIGYELSIDLQNKFNKIVGNNY